MKRCTKCREEKDISLFYRLAVSADGRSPICKTCANWYVSQWCLNNRALKTEIARRSRAKNIERVRASALKWYHSNKIAQAEYRKRNRAKYNGYSAKYRRKNLDKRAAIEAKHRVGKRTPQWANEFFISEAYHLAGLRTKKFGFEWQVDHIVPLRSKLVCGLHVENNLQVIPARENASKRNFYWPDMP